MFGNSGEELLRSGWRATDMQYFDAKLGRPLNLYPRP